MLLCGVVWGGLRGVFGGIYGGLGHLLRASWTGLEGSCGCLGRLTRVLEASRIVVFLKNAETLKVLFFQCNLNDF